LNCPSCGHENATDAAFCNKCGAGLQIICALCRRSNRGDSAFCAGCGQKLTAGTPAAAPPAPLSYTPRHLAEKILRERSALEGERRNVTVLFADAMGFTPLSERVDAEEVYGLMQGCLARMMDAVHKYEGTITNFTGDGVMALFGAPIAHEDSARRAVSAALEMQRSLADYSDDVKRKHPIDCRFRVGLNSGPVVVGKISDNLDMDYTALGDTVNLASRMEEAAEPGTVCLTEDTYRQAGDYFDCEALGALMVKGKSAPVVAYRAIRPKAAVRTRLQAQAERGLTPFVGRRQELSVLKGYFEQAKGGRGQVVFITGEAGLGKSRLLLEFRRSVIDEPLTWLEGHCISYGKRIPYLPIADLIKRNFGIDETDNEEQIISRVEEGAGGWHEATRKTLPYLRYLLNVDPGDEAVAAMDPMERRAGVLDALRALLVQESRKRLLVLVIEDLHWVDEKSEEALSAVVDAVQSLPVLMVLTYRPGYSPSLGERTYYSRLSLSHLPADESAVIAERVLHVSALPEAVRGLITSKGEGNPFYIEEVTRSLVESGVLTASNGSYALERPLDQVRVPDTIQEVIMSRIDRLEQEAKEAIQLASVIGREFTARLLNRVSDVEAKLDDLLVQLKQLELIFEKDYFPELSYMFKHALTHDVAYSTLLMERRKGLHRMVGAAIEELYHDRLTEQYEALAHHYYEAQDWEKAVEYLEKAGDKAVAAFANGDALEHYARALEVCEKIGPEAMRTAATIAEKRAFVNFGIGSADDGAADFARVLECGQALGDRRMEGMALTWMGNMHSWGSQPEKGEQCMREALVIANEGGYTDVKAAAVFWLGSMTRIYGKIEESGPFIKEADELVPELGDPFTLGFWAFMGGMMENWEGRYGASLGLLERWRPAMDGSVFTLTARLWNEALALGGQGEYGAALSRLHEALADCERTGEMLVRARALNTVGWILSELQDHEAAIEWDKRSEEAALQINAPDPEIESNARLNMGDSLRALGRLDEAEKYYEIVEQVVRNATPRERFAVWLYSQHLFHSYGELWLQRGDYAKAMSYADECIELAESTNRPKNVVKGHRLRGQALLALDKPDEAEPEIEMALAIAQEIGNPPQIWKTYVALGQVRQAQGRPDEAKNAYAEAVAVIENVASRLEDESLRATFLSSPHVGGIREAAGEGAPDSAG
jgi:class 3 adenylate cyclase/tetratricopeptide (TPR) repeat protein